ncbi:hypothetical protein NFI96_022791 [Prochilodus magdalenae]|nr:hypothetical protein NFI96_022791 [Prochilodus magdalenae]
MNPLTGKMLLIQNMRALVQAVSLIRRPLLKQQMPLGFMLTERQYRSMPTHGIGRYSFLLPKEQPKKKKEKVQMKQIKAATDIQYGVLNVAVSGYDMTLVEHYSQYIHNLCNRLDIKVDESYGLPTKTTEVMVMPEHGTKMYVDVVLKTHERVVQVRTVLLSYAHKSNEGNTCSYIYGSPPKKPARGSAALHKGAH